MPTTVDDYNAMLKEIIGPRLRELGFRGSSGVYTRPDPAHFIRIRFQKSVYGSRQHVKFTLNVSAINKAQWNRARQEEDYLPKEPSASRYYGHEYWQRRIGQLMPSKGSEPWWELTPDTDAAAVGRDVLSAIETYALPAIEAAVRDE